MKTTHIAPPKAVKTIYPVFRQILMLIAPNLVHETEREHPCRARTFSPWSHLVALLFHQLAHTLSLNGVCDQAATYAAKWQTLRGATAPCRNTFSNANRHRDPAFAEALYWKLVAHFSAESPAFLRKTQKGYLGRFRNRRIRLLDSSTICLALNCIDWARHRAKKAAAKLHVLLDLACRLPTVAIIDAARPHDSVRAPDAAASLVAGDILAADRAYSGYPFLSGLAERGVFYVVRAKSNYQFRVVKRLAEPREADPALKTTQILSDDLVSPALKGSAEAYKADGGVLRRVVARVKVDKTMRTLTFLTNHLAWSARTVAEIYRSRWEIEVFFKELKQTCQLRDFLGYSENAVKWQIWTALIAHLLLRYLEFLHGWKLSHSRLAGVIRGSLWLNRNLGQLLSTFGMAGGRTETKRRPKPAVLQGFLPWWRGMNGMAGA